MFHFMFHFFCSADARPRSVTLLLWHRLLTAAYITSSSRSHRYASTFPHASGFSFDVEDEYVLRNCSSPELSVKGSVGE